MRDDAGELWESYVLVERMKYNLYNGRLAESYFWRTYDRQEIDLVEEWGGQLLATEMKWTARSHRAPGAWPIPTVRSRLSIRKITSGSYLTRLPHPRRAPGCRYSIQLVCAMTVSGS